MKKQFGLALGLCLSLSLLSVSSVSNAAPQVVGTKCVKAGSFRTTKNVRYRCKKSAQGLRWVTISAGNKKTTPVKLPTTTSKSVPLKCSTGGACVVGDTGPGGGKVFYVHPEDGVFTSADSQCETSCKYLEAAPVSWSTEKQTPAQDQCQILGSSTEDPKCEWSGNVSTDIGSDAQGLVIGSGSTNTTAIIKNNSEPGKAATAARAYQGGGKKDWYLPSIYELGAMYEQANVIGGTETKRCYKSAGNTWSGYVNWDGCLYLRSAFFWSSSENSLVYLSAYASVICFGEVDPRLAPDAEGRRHGNGSWCLKTEAPSRKWTENKYATYSVRPIRAFGPLTTTSSTKNLTTTTTSTIPQIKLATDPRVSPAKNLSSANDCKMSDVTRWPSQNTSSGFPRSEWRPTSKGTLKVLILPITFSDIPFTDSDAMRLLVATSKVNDFYRSVSYGKAGVHWKLADRSDWVNLGKKADDYGLITGPHTLDKTNLIKEVLLMTSPSLKLSEYGAVAIQTGYDSRNYFGQGFILDPETAFKTPSGNVMSAVFDGGQNAGGWNALAHELGHGWLGFEDLYYFGSNDSFFGRWDLMNNAGSDGAELSAWHRFLVGWIDDSQIRCVPKGSGTTTHFISALTAKNNLPKAVTHLISNGQMLVVESRRTGGFDTAGSVTVVYVVDTNIPHSQAPFRLVGELTRIGDKVAFAGAVVELVDADKDGDLVLVTAKN